MLILDDVIESYLDPVDTPPTQPLPVREVFHDGRLRARDLAANWAIYGVVVIQGKLPTDGELAAAVSNRLRTARALTVNAQQRYKRGVAGHADGIVAYSDVDRAWAKEAGIVLTETIEGMKAEPEETRPCPTCGEKILAVAKKCRFCGQWLEGAPGKKVASVVAALLVALGLAIPARAQIYFWGSCEQRTISATGRSRILANSAASLVAGQFSYVTTGTPAGVSIAIEAGNEEVATQTPFTKIAAVTNTTGADMGTAAGAYRFWWANVATLSGGASPTIRLTSCFSPHNFTAGGGSLQVQGTAAAGAPPVGNPVYVGGTDGTNVRGLRTDTIGRLTVVSLPNPTYPTEFHLYTAAVPNAATTATATTGIYSVTCANTTAAPVTILVTDNQGSPITFVPTFSVPANSILTYPDYGYIKMLGVKWTAGAATSMNCGIEGWQ